jgi:hypothetical protein
MKRITAALVGVSLIFTGLTTGHADEIIGEQFEINPPSVQSIGAIIDDSAMIKKQWSSLQAFTGDGPNNTGNVTSVQNCPSYGSQGCESDKYFNFKSLLPYCKSSISHNCIASLIATGPDGVPHEAIYEEDFPGASKFEFVENIEANLPASGSNFIVSIPSLPHFQGDKYLVVSAMSGNKSALDKKFNIDIFTTGIFAVKIVEGKYSTQSSSLEVKEYAHVGMTAGGGLPRDLNSNKLAACAQLTATRCALPYPLPLDVNFELTLRMKTPVTGWLHGRLGEASASISYDSKSNEIVKIGGKPVVVPIVYTDYPKTQLPSVIKDFYVNDPNFETMGFKFGTPNDGGLTVVKIFDRYDAREFPAALAWYQAISDKAPYAASAWSFRSIQSGGLGGNCRNNITGLSGLVSTNSNMYVAEPPIFNKEDQSLDYKVTSPHFLPDGTVFKGNYNLVINGDFARCLYGFSKAPVAAKVEILSSDGSQQVATTVLSERDGWIRLSASNFTFSAPTIKVKLVQAKTIVCIKGKTIKKVTSLTPKCPTGYKKKG